MSSAPYRDTLCESQGRCEQRQENQGDARAVSGRQDLAESGPPGSLARTPNGEEDPRHERCSSRRVTILYPTDAKRDEEDTGAFDEIAGDLQRSQQRAFLDSEHGRAQTDADGVTQQAQSCES